jgi:hypothetical protein
MVEFLPAARVLKLETYFSRVNLINYN